MRWWKKKAKEVEPDGFSSIIAKGLELASIGKYDESESCYYDAWSINPVLVDAIWITSARSKYPDGLDSLISDALSIDPHRADDAADHEKHIATLDKVLGIHPQNTRTLIYKGYQLDALGRHDEALECYNKAVKINPRAIWLLCRKGSIYFDYGKYEEAFLWYDKVLKIDPHNHLVMLTMALIKSNLNEKKESYDYLKKAIDLNPEYKEGIKKDLNVFKNIRDESEFIKLVS